MSPTILTLLALPTLSAAYSWKFDSAPQQCQPLKISISGSDGQPPYRILVIPFGSSPFANNTEVRKIVDQPFADNANSLSLNLNYPAFSQFVAVVSFQGALYGARMRSSLAYPFSFMINTDAIPG